MDKGIQKSIFEIQFTIPILIAPGALQSQDHAPNDMHHSSVCGKMGSPACPVTPRCLPSVQRSQPRQRTTTTTGKENDNVIAATANGNMATDNGQHTTTVAPRVSHYILEQHEW